MSPPHDRPHSNITVAKAPLVRLLHRASTCNAGKLRLAFVAHLSADCLVQSSHHLQTRGVLSIRCCWAERLNDWLCAGDRFNENGYENADLCAWTFSQNTFPTGGGLANVRWTCPAPAKKQGCTDRYYLVQVSFSPPFILYPESNESSALLLCPIQIDLPYSQPQ